MDAIKVTKLTKCYKNKTMALNDLSLNVKQGEIFTLLGKNGAGKSSLINTLTTFLKPTSGDVRILGKDLRKEAAGIRKIIACVAQKVTIDTHLSLSENMIFQGRLYGMDSRTIKNRMERLIKSFRLEDYQTKKTAVYSGGILRRLDIAMSMISNPRILFLDEPTVGLDIESRMTLWELIRQIQTEYHTTVFLTTHYLEEADRLSDTVCIIKDGQELIQDTPEHLKKSIDTETPSLDDVFLALTKERSA